MCAHKANKHLAKFALDGDDQAITVAADIEHNPIVGNDRACRFRYGDWRSTSGR
jgi:hypothetical protein